jgi:hypothetical protein
LDELAVILAAPVFTQAIRLKRAMPGTEVMSVIQPEDVGPVFTGDTESGYVMSDKELEVMKRVGEEGRKAGK